MGKPLFNTAHETAGFTKHSLLLFIPITAYFGRASLVSTQKKVEDF